MEKKCIWCLKKESEVNFDKKAHTIPLSLGGQNYYKNICDNCNKFFGSRSDENRSYSIEEALKEAFNISRKRLLNSNKTQKRKTGRFKSKFFEIKEKKNKLTLTIKSSFRFNKTFQIELCRAFKRGLYKMFFEELCRQKEVGYEEKFNIIRDFARYNNGDLPVVYYERRFGAFIMFENEAETPILYFDRMDYLYSNEKFIEIEFLGHVFGFPITNFDKNDFNSYIKNSLEIKSTFFKKAILIERMTDVDITMKIMGK